MLQLFICLVHSGDRRNLNGVSQPWFLCRMPGVSSDCRIGCLLLVQGLAYGRKCFDRYCWKIWLFDHPESDMTPLAPTEPGLKRFPLKIKYDGSVWPKALTQPIIVVVVLLGDVIAWHLVLGLATMFGGRCSGFRLVSSKLLICCCLLCKLFRDRTASSFS